MSSGNDMDPGRPKSLTFSEFVQERDLLLAPKANETVRSLAQALVKVMELVAIHGSTGTGNRPDGREALIDTLMGRIQAAASGR